ncbi:MAG TPA: DUF6452 family protein [Bacteroidales bacterium]|nr:hypothetical protein [Bacteroidales bacterium]HCI56139.1 hypothetical protein [Bacteroidales bacterium]HOU96163.1 DUF6452 family protein [Bacteroidales bacterium]HQG52696.1 DUF6452 family protein [Bacteroidales bacterium]HRC89235.1 DUF6452 family protein [Bacteroidales bacterium]
MKSGVSLYYLAFCSILSALSLVSCTPKSCKEETEILAGATFYKTGTGMISAPDTLTLFGMGNKDSLLYDKAIKISVIYIPLDPNNDLCRFVLTIKQESDTLTFIYSPYAHLLSKECGYAFFYYLSECRFTKNILDTVIIRNPRITNRNEENIRIFF